MNTDARLPEAVRTRIGVTPKFVPAVAWGTTLAMSALPAIAFSVVSGRVPAWLLPGQVALAAAVVGVTIWTRVRALRRFAVVMVAMPVLLLLTSRWDLGGSVPLLFGQSGFAVRMQEEQIEKLIVAAGMIGVLLMLGLSRRDFFLRVGDVSAPMRPVRLLGFPHSDPWWRFGLIWGCGIASALAVVQFLIVRPSAAQVASIVPLLPAILLFAALNAFSEEMTYRAPMIATLGPAVGGQQALWQSAVLFGVAHYFGIPGGLSGAVLAIFMGWILGKAMRETRGLLWPWFIHFLSDVSIFVFLAMAST